MKFAIKFPSSVLSILLTVALAAAFTGCKGAQKSGSGSDAGSISESDINADAADSDSGRAMGLQTVHYDYDSSTLSGEAKSTLDNNARVLNENENVKIQIEGHTDERGGIQYNIALGERRARSARSYLVDKGVAANRITIISYGKEKPVDPASNEDAWAKNRRANFRITAK